MSVETKKMTLETKPVLGVLAIISVVAIYSSNLVVTRYSVLNGLTALDLTALRYSVAGVVLLPYFFRLGVRDLGGLGWPKAIVLSCLAGAPYFVLFFYGLSFAPSAHAAVLNPSIVPSVVFVGTVLLRRERFSLVRGLSLALIVIGVVLVTGASFSEQGPVLLGDALLLCTGISWGLFTLLTKEWELRPMQAATIISVLSLAYLPPYFLFACCHFDSASVSHVVLQAVFQGIINSIAALYLLTYAVRQLGVLMTSLFSPVVPVITTMLAIALLGEVPAAVQWAGLIIVVAGMLSSAKLNTEDKRPK